MENLAGGIRQPPLGAGRQPHVPVPPMRAADHNFGDAQLFAAMGDRDATGMLDRLEALLARYLGRKRPRRLRSYFLGDDPTRRLGERHLLGSPQLEIAAHPVLFPFLDGPIDDDLPALPAGGTRPTAGPCGSR